MGPASQSNLAAWVKGSRFFGLGFRVWLHRWGNAGLFKKGLRIKVVALSHHRYEEDKDYYSFDRLKGLPSVGFLQDGWFKIQASGPSSQTLILGSLDFLEHFAELKAFCLPSLPRLWQKNPSMKALLIETSYEP